MSVTSFASAPTPTECYDANPAFGVGECWNANASGQALSIGVEGSTASFGQIVRRAFVHRSWNGVGIYGANTLEHSRFWGFPNHTLGGCGDGRRHPTQRLPERAGLDLLRAQCLRRPHRRAQRVRQRRAFLGQQQRRLAACHRSRGGFATTSSRRLPMTTRPIRR